MLYATSGVYSGGKVDQDMRTRLHNPTLGDSSVRLEQPTAQHLAAVKRAFVALFHVQPSIKVQGLFPASAIKPGPQSPDEIDARRDWLPVGRIGRMFVEVGEDFVIPEAGKGVTFSLRIPD